MDIEFRDSRLSLIETDRAMETRLPVSVITSCRHKLVVLRAAPDERTLRNWKSLHYEKLEGDRSGQRSIRLNKQWRLVFTLNSDLTRQDLLFCRLRITTEARYGTDGYRLGDAPRVLFKRRDGCARVASARSCVYFRSSRAGG